MSDFRDQILEDIKEYQLRFPLVENLQKEEWAFNYWILDKFFYEEEELILDKIIDYNDRGIDAYEWYEDTKELYIIQNKFYTTTKISEDYVKNNFLILPLQTLENGTYTRCPELQHIYNQNKDHEKFTVHLQIYISNNLKNDKADAAIRRYNEEHSPHRHAEILYLSNIEDKWYGEARHSTKELKVKIESVNSGTILNINNDAYKLGNDVDAKYVFTPVTCIYRMMKTAQEKGYMLFEKNIREYLGNKGINKNIYLTLKDPVDRKNFFYYNNGITIICNRISSIKNHTQSKNPHIGVAFDIQNPQIVNGCQTVNSIYAVLKDFDEDDLEETFKDTFVMVKVLQIDTKNPVEEELSKMIVTFNNSQNAIDQKTFVANNELFQRLKNEFETKGFLLITKQSDKNTFSVKYKKQSELTKLRAKSLERVQLFGLEDCKKLTDFYIPLEKLLQVILAFKEGGLAAFTLKKDVLKTETSTYSSVVNFIKSSNVTTEVLLNLYLLYIRSEKEKNANSGNGNIVAPIPFYLIDGFSTYECQGRNSKAILDNLGSSEKINHIIKLYTKVCRMYTRRMKNEHDVEYIKMLKMDIDYNKFRMVRDEVLDIMD